MNFIAIDFETANSSRDSACALGAVVVKDSKIVERRYSLINPQVPFQKYCTHIHGIDEEAVKKSPSFNDIHSVLFKLFNNNVIAAHNAVFDIEVFKSSCKSRNLKIPEFETFCSLEMSRKAWPNFEYHKLNYICEQFNFPLNHHNAIEDATACALIILKCAQEYKVDSFEELDNALNKKSKIEERKLIKYEKTILKKIAAAKVELERDSH